MNSHVQDGQDVRMTGELARRVMGWRTSPGRFIKANRSWTPTWKFQPLKKLEHAMNLLERAAPQYFALEGDDKTEFRVKIQIAGVIGEARGQSKPRTITYAIARAIGITVPPVVDGRKSNAARQTEGA